MSSDVVQPLPQEVVEKLSPEQLYGDLIESYKREIEQLHREVGAWQLMAYKAPRLEEENDRLKREIAGIKQANAELNRRCHGPQPVEIAR